VLEVRDGVVHEIGITDPRVTASRRAARRLLAGW
jgi:hypothetical protein